MRMPGTIYESTVVAATPGWEYVIFIDGIVVGRLASEPIIAWEVIVERSGQRVHREAVPITASGAGPDQLSNPWAIKRPDGVYEIPGDSTFDCQWDLLDHFKKQVKASGAR